MPTFSCRKPSLSLQPSLCLPGKFSYTKLGTDQIKIPRLHPRTPSASIQAQLIKVQIRETASIEYEALFYAWEKSIPTLPVFLSDAGLSYSLNYNMFSQCRQPPGINARWKCCKCGKSNLGHHTQCQHHYGGCGRERD